MSNREKINSMTNEELADLIVGGACSLCKFQYGSDNCGTCSCKDGVLLWLKETKDMKKYELTENTKEFVDVTFFQIRALKSFGDVKKGDLGGWIEKEENLSQEGDCWVYDRAEVRGNARVYENAKVCEDAWVSGNAQIYGNAQVYGETRISDNARIYGNAQVYGNADVYNNAKIYGNAKVYECADVYEEAWVCGNACAFGNAKICKDACITRNAKVNGHRLPGLF